MDVSQYVAQYGRLRRAYAARDRAMQEMRQVREGRMSDVFPDLFPADGPMADKALVANMVDVAARDVRGSSATAHIQLLIVGAHHRRCQKVR